MVRRHWHQRRLHCRDWDDAVQNRYVSPIQIIDLNMKCGRRRHCWFCVMSGNETAMADYLVDVALSLNKKAIYKDWSPFGIVTGEF